MKKLFAIALLASFTTLAAPLQWTCNWPDARPQTFSLYQGETATFEPTFRVNGQLATNVTIEAVWYQTNGMDQAWWKLDGNTFAPSNDVGAAAYRFFVEASIPQSNNPNNSNNQTILYRANGTLRMLPSPGFTPSAIELPVRTLDFATIEIANAPWLEEETDPNVPSWAKAANPPLPPDYAAVSNLAYGAALAAEVPRVAQASTNYTDAATNALAQSSASAFMPASFTESDPTISSWAKAATKPSYTASEVGATTPADIAAAISPTSPAFSNAVLSVGLGIDTNTVAVINELVDSAHDLPVTGATSVGALLLALAAAVAALKKRLPYAIVAKTIENGAVSLDDRAINAVAVSSSLASLTVNFPTATSGKARDFGLRLTVASGITTAPELALPQGVTCENADGEAPEIGADGAATILYFTETASGVFLVKGEVVTAIS